MSDDEIGDPGKEIAKGVATTPDAAPATEQHAQPWQINMSEKEERALREDVQRRKEAAQTKRQQDNHDALVTHRMQESIHGGYDANELIDPRAFLEREQASKEPVRPVFPRRGENPNTVSLEERTQFLINYMNCGVWNHAAYLVGRSGRTFRELAKVDPHFGIMVAEAVQDWRENLQSEAIRRGMHGTLEPIFAGKDGDLVGYKRTYSDTLLKMELEASWPSRYRTTQNPIIDEAQQRNQGVMVVPGVSTKEEWIEDGQRKQAELKAVGKITRTVNRTVKPTDSAE